MDTEILSNITELSKLFQYERVLLLLLGLLLLVVLVKLVNISASRIYQRFPSRRIIVLQFTTIIVFIIYIFGGVYLVYSVLQPPRELLIAIGGSAAVAIGFSLKDIAASVIAGLIILFDRPFQVGDRVTFGSVYGEINKIGLRAVRIVTLDDNMVTVPNSKFISDYVASGNAGALEMMIVVNFHVSLQEDTEKVRNLLYEIAVTSRFVYLGKPVSIVIEEAEVAEKIVQKFSVKAYVLDVRYEKAFQTDLVTRTMKVFQANSILRP